MIMMMTITIIMIMIMMMITMIIIMFMIMIMITIMIMMMMILKPNLPTHPTEELTRISRRKSAGILASDINDINDTRELPAKTIFVKKSETVPARTHPLPRNYGFRDTKNAGPQSRLSTLLELRIFGKNTRPHSGYYSRPLLVTDGYQTDFGEIPSFFY